MKSYLALSAVFRLFFRAAGVIRGIALENNARGALLTYLHRRLFTLITQTAKWYMQAR